MQLTQTQKTLLKTHMQANTNTTPATDSQGNPLTTPFVINTRLVTRNPDDQAAIAAWYNLAALATDNQPFANLNVWNPQVTQRQLNAAINWAQDPRQDITPTDAQITNAWLKWQSMTWAGTQLDSGVLDMSDGGVRKGVTSVWGDVAAKNAAKIGGAGCGQRGGTNLELVVSNAATGATVGTAFTDAHPVQKDANGSLIYGQQITQPQVDDVLQTG